MSSVSTFSIDASEWPGRDDLSEFLHQSNAKDEVHKYLTEEFDTLITFRVEDTNLLSGYPEAFFLPLHAFARSLSQLLKQMEANNEGRVPIYLQQYAVSEGEPAHTLSFTQEGDAVQFRLEWGGESTPEGWDSQNTVSLSRADFRSETARFLDFYTRKIVLLLSPLPRWSEDQIGQLFSDF